MTCISYTYLFVNNIIYSILLGIHCFLPFVTHNVKFARPSRGDNSNCFAMDQVCQECVFWGGGAVGDGVSVWV